MNNEWETPDDLWDKLDEEFEFSLDAACTKLNCKDTPRHIFKDDNEDSLRKDWGVLCTTDELPRTVWLNPPYSRGNIDKFMEKAYNEFLKGCTVVALVRDDPSTSWYRKWVDGKAAEVRRLVRRVRFVGADSAYNFPCCVVVYSTDGYPTKYHLWDWK